MNVKRKLTIRFLLFFCFLFFIQLANAQINSDLTLILNSVKKKSEINNDSKKNKLNNPIKVLAYVPLFFYQKILSEQISATCEFDLSCSNFSIEAIKHYGIFYGIFLTADRLTRCNGNAQTETESYLINHKSGKVIDEPSMYSLCN